MELTKEKRDAIAEVGKSLGAKDEAIRKWFQRGIPGKWHLPLLAESRRMRKGLSAADLLAAAKDRAA